MLAPYIKQYWAIENSLACGATYSQRIIPSGLMEVTFYFSNLPEASVCSKNIGSSSIVSGQLNTYYDLQITGNLSMFSISFKPMGALMFFNVPLNEFANKNVPLEFVLTNAKDIEDQLFHANNFAQRITIIEKFLYDLLTRNQKAFEFKRIHSSIKHLTKNEESDVISLANTACLSRKQFERRFIASVGLSPKQYMRVVQFQRTIFNKQIHPDLSLTELSYKTGYYDQSHMVNNFKSLSGLTPKEFFAICPPISDYFSV